MIDVQWTVLKTLLQYETRSLSGTTLQGDRTKTHFPHTTCRRQSSSRAAQRGLFFTPSLSVLLFFSRLRSVRLIGLNLASAGLLRIRDWPSAKVTSSYYRSEFSISQWPRTALANLSPLMHRLVIVM